MATMLTTYRDLRVYGNAMEACMKVFELSKSFPAEERFSLTDQLRRSSRSVCANLAEAWRSRRYPAAFVSKLTECTGEASESQVWLEIARRCGYLSPEQAGELSEMYEHVAAQLVTMIQAPDKWSIPKTPAQPSIASATASPMVRHMGSKPARASSEKAC